MENKGSFLCVKEEALLPLHTLTRMSQIVDQRLFELIQLVSVSTSSLENEPRRRFSLRTTETDHLLSRCQSRQIVSFSASPCGRLVVFAAASLSETGPDSPENRPFIGAVLLSSNPESSLLPLSTNCDSIRESVEAEVQWLPWFQDSKYRPTCLTLSPESDFCLIGCENGSLFILSTKTLCPAGFEPRTDKDSNHRDWSNKRTHKIYPIDFSDSKGEWLKIRFLENPYSFNCF